MNVANTEKGLRRRTAIVVGIVLTGGLLPLVLYWVFCGSVPTITPAKAGRLLQAPNSVKGGAKSQKRLQMVEMRTRF